ncbi:unnamed protein product [Clonostachys chloroleuca]|uniref:C2H2-type domain-containing protein n=1 Tax=Clonostachys chloroleuca TaxID=1926264 RepID=A0AA35Q3J7_9HYPO|nr:unnamed protein product [Clonostachys chloroleuca]
MKRPVSCAGEINYFPTQPLMIRETRTPRASNSPLACPFYKFNPVLYDECKKFQFARTSDMKQHLVRSHSVSEPSTLSCNVCHSPFVDEQSKRLHLREGGCSIVAVPEKLSLHEVASLKETKFPRGSSAASQWFAIWNQLFPGHTQPQTPYKESNSIKETISLFSPTVEIYLHDAFPILSQQHPQNNVSPVKIIIDKACRDFCNSFPISRQVPSTTHPSLNNAGHSQGSRIAPATLASPSFTSPNHDATALVESHSFGNNLPSMAPTIDSALGFELGGISASINAGLDNTFFIDDQFSRYIHEHTFGHADTDESGFAE